MASALPRRIARPSVVVSARDRRRRALLSAIVWLGAVAGALLTWSWSDVLTWQRIFEAGGLYQYDAAYQSGHQVVLFGLIALGVMLLLRSGLVWAAAYALAVYTLAYGGVADLLYYWLDRRALPSALPWLDSSHPLIVRHPVTAAGLEISAALWVGLWLTLLAVQTWRCARPERSADGPAPLVEGGVTI